MPNRLASERSAYLRSAAHQPVDWLPWGKEVFEQAKREDKPLLLDIKGVRTNTRASGFHRVLSVTSPWRVHRARLGWGGRAPRA